MNTGKHTAFLKPRFRNMATDVIPTESSPQAAPKFGTFLGVYTPSVLTILGLIMYLRFGWVVGNVGLPITLFIVLLASSITLITALSASAVATNMRVGVGGEYYLISHNLGVIAETCQTVVVMYRGRIVEFATTADLFASACHP